MIKSIRMRWTGHVTRVGDKSGAYRVLVENLDGKSPVGRPRRIWENNIKMNLLDVGWGGMDRIDVPQRRESWRALVSAVMNVRISQNATQSTPPHKAHLDPWHTTTQGTKPHKTRHHTKHNTTKTHLNPCHTTTQGTKPHKARHHTKHTTTKRNLNPWHTTTQAGYRAQFFTSRLHVRHHCRASNESIFYYLRCTPCLLVKITTN
jgi:hypothetical protein